MPMVTVTDEDKGFTEADPLVLTQSGTILKTLRDLYSPQPSGREKYRTDEHVDAALDLYMGNKMMNFPTSQGGPDAVKAQVRFMKPYAKYLDGPKSLGGVSEGKFLVGTAEPTIADFAWYHALDAHRTIDSKALSSVGNVRDWMERVESVAGVGEYLENRVGLEERGENTVGKK